MCPSVNQRCLASCVCSAANGAAAERPVALPVQPTVSPLAGHTVNEWGDKLVIVGGHVKVGGAWACLSLLYVYELSRRGTRTSSFAFVRPVQINSSAGCCDTYPVAWIRA